MQVLLDGVEKFAKRYNYADLVTKELRKRAESDGKAVELYRHSTVPMKSFFLASPEDDILVVEKYNAISDRWDLFCKTKMEAINDRMFSKLLLAEGKIFLIGGKGDHRFERKVT